MPWKAPRRNRSSAEAWACGVLCKGCLAHRGCCRCLKKVGHQRPWAWQRRVTGNIRVTTQAGRLKNTVTNVFIYQKRRVLEVFCLFLESTRFPKETARLLSTPLRLRQNIFHANFFPANGVVSPAAKHPLSSCWSCQGQQRVSTDCMPERKASHSTFPLSFLNEMEQIRSKYYLYLTVQSTQCPKWRESHS